MPTAAQVRERLQWTLPFAFFLIYVFVVTTYQIPIATVAAIGSLLSLPLLGRLRLPAPLLIFAVYLVWTGFGYTQSEFPARTAESWQDLAKAWLIMLVAINALQTKRHVMLVVVFFLGCYALFPVRGTYFNYFIYRETTNGRVAWNFIYNNANDLAAFTLVPIALCMGICATRPKRDWIWWSAAAGLFMLPLMIFLTQSRGGIIALAVLIMFSLLGQRRRARSFAILLSVAAVVAIVAPKSVWTRLRGLKNATDATTLSAVDPEGSAEQRYEIWKVGLTIARDHPITGIGLGSYRYVHARYAELPIFKPTARGLRDTHNTYINVLAETGFPGLAVFMTLLIASFVHAERIRRRIRASFKREAQQLLFLELGIGSFLLAGMFGTYAHLGFLYLYLAIMYAMAETSLANATAVAPSIGARPPVRRVFRPA